MRTHTCAWLYAHSPTYTHTYSERTQIDKENTENNIKDASRFICILREMIGRCCLLSFFSSCFGYVTLLILKLDISLQLLLISIILILLISQFYLGFSVLVVFGIFFCFRLRDYKYDRARDKSGPRARHHCFCFTLLLDLCGFSVNSFLKL